MSETPTPKPGELWETNVAYAAELRADGEWYRADGDRLWHQGQTLIRLAGYTVAYVETLRARAEAEKWRFVENVIAARDTNEARANMLSESVRIAREERDEAVARADQLAIELDEKVARLVDRNNLLVESLESAEATLKAEQENWLAGDLPTITEREPWRVLRSAAAVMNNQANFDVPESDRLRALANRLEREHGETAKRDRLIEKVADILGDFAVADEHSGERNDVQLARLLVGRGVTLAEAVDHDWP